MRSKKTLFRFPKTKMSMFAVSLEVEAHQFIHFYLNEVILTAGNQSVFPLSSHPLYLYCMNRMNTVNSRQDQVIEEFDMFSDWMEKYEHIIEIGKELSPMLEDEKVEDNLIKGCQSRVWLSAKRNTAGEVVFGADSDAIITKGLVALMVRVLSNSQASEIAAADLYFLEKIGLHAHLSSTRSNGLASMVKQMKMYGLVYSARS